jgi:hypothetical protein
MPIRTSVKQSLTVFTAEGPLSVDDIVEAITSFYKNGRTKDSLWDLRKALLKDYPAEGAQRISQVASVYRQERAGGKTAIVAPRDVVYGISRMHQAYMADFPWKLEVFRTIDDACGWLGVELDATEKHDDEAG